MSESRVVTFGEGLAVLVAPGPGPAEQASHLEVGVGGAELNVSIALSRLGHAVTWAGVVGDDPWGRRIVRELQAEGVAVCARIADDAFTGAYLRERRTRDLMRATYLRRGSAGSRLAYTDLTSLKLGPGDILHMTGVTPALSDTANAAWTSIAARAEAAGALVSLDINHRSALTTSAAARATFDQVSRYIGLVMASTDEADIVCGTEGMSPKQASTALQAKIAPGGEVVIKDGANGSLHLSSEGEVTTAPAVTVDVEDLVGAGDAFAAGYLSASLDLLPALERLQRGHACAAFVVSTRGDWEGAPRRSELSLASTLATSEVHR